jgi:hypothetical protein
MGGSLEEVFRVLFRAMRKSGKLPGMIVVPSGPETLPQLPFHRLQPFMRLSRVVLRVWQTTKGAQLSLKEELVV